MVDFGSHRIHDSVNAIETKRQRTPHSQIERHRCKTAQRQGEWAGAPSEQHWNIDHDVMGLRPQIISIWYRNIWGNVNPCTGRGPPSAKSENCKTTYDWWPDIIWKRIFLLFLHKIFIIIIVLSFVASPIIVCVVSRAVSTHMWYRRAFIKETANERQTAKNALQL